jgi:hypothetical protein
MLVLKGWTILLLLLRIVKARYVWYNRAKVTIPNLKNRLNQGTKMELSTQSLKQMKEWGRNIKKLYLKSALKSSQGFRSRIIGKCYEECLF